MKLFNEAVLRLVVGVQALTSPGARERGQTLAEYGLILAFIATAIIVGAVIAFRSAIATAFNEASNCWL